MKLKKLCTLCIVTMLILTGCKAGNEEVTKDNSEVKATGETIKEEVTDDSKSTQTKISEKPKVNPNYSNNEIYFDMYKDSINLDEINSKDISNGEKDTFYIYQPDSINGTDEVFKIEKKLISKELSVEEKLIILCDYLENKLGDIKINIQSNTDDKFAVVMAIEKYPRYGSMEPIARGGMIKETLKQSGFDGKWFEHVEVIYDAGTFGDI